MAKLLQKIQKNKLTLIVSLPQNSLELAKAAESGGADALKIHLNVVHQASGTHFGSFGAEKENLKKIVAGVKIPVGIMPGAEVCAAEDEMEEMVGMGFDFFDMYMQDAPAWMYLLENITKIIALAEKYNEAKLFALADKGADLVEASIVKQSAYGDKLNIGDIQSYLNITIASQLPVIVPTQKKIEPDEVSLLFDSGLKGLMIGAIVTGQTPPSLEKSTRAFRQAIDSLADKQ